MKAAPFDYQSPRDLVEALQILNSVEDSRVLAGGQTLVPMMAFRYDGNGEPLSVTFADYLMPTITEMPDEIQVLITEDAPSPLNPLGVKGAGEAGPMPRELR
jgi:CO/xanthine dehydrogenase Mo-binding subunit